MLIGDDEHGWSDEGVFNFEGGCYAKAIRLSPEGEPEIYATTREFGTLAENVALTPDRAIDFDDATITENTRLSYPISFIPNASADGMGGVPETVVFLTADAFGVLPPISKLTPEQAQYHFLSGYTAKVAGTERGVTEPKATFSACFGEPFMVLPPSRYAEMLGERIERTGARVFLVNTGWTGGPYGTGERMKLAWTRAHGRRRPRGRARRRRDGRRSRSSASRCPSPSRASRTRSSARARRGPTPPPTTPRPGSSPRCSRTTSRSTART